jgi:short-subunit dehydrogenase
MSLLFATACLMAKMSNKAGIFAGRSLVLTGASSGLGAALALSLARQGGRLTLLARAAEPLEEVGAECRRVGGEVLCIAGDVTVAADCERLMSAAAQKWGKIDYLIANAGASMWARFEEVEDLEIFRRLMEVNYMGAVHCIHYALPHLRRSGGLFAAVSSIQGKIGVPLHSGYVAAKHALQGFCDTLRMELDGSGVDVLTVMPHWLQGTNLRQSAFGGDGKALGATSRRHNKESISLEQASEWILAAMTARQRQLIFPWKLKALVALNLVAPKRAEALIKGAMNKQDS